MLDGSDKVAAVIQRLSIFTVMRAYRRLIAGASIALVLALAVFAASPEAHDWLCHHSKAPSAQGDEAEGCVVTTFASGHLLALATLLLALLFVVSFSSRLFAVKEGEYAESERVLPESCGPPVRG